LFYYHTKYGTPLAYARAIDLLGRDEKAPWAGWAGRRVLDFGYGTIGHLRLMALNGADVVGVDVDTLLTALYSEPSDTAPLPGIEGPQGNVTLVEGHFPGDAPVRAKVGGGFDLFLSKNTLKRGYVHPSRPADERMLLNLGVDDETYVRAVFDLLKPGGRFMIYNICPPPSPPDEPYKPWSDGRCPFDKELLERVGFEVASFDVDDTPALRAMARLLAWDARHDIDNDLFAWFTLARRPPTGVERGF
jgi:SAM-dependent methyltransferase